MSGARGRWRRGARRRRGMAMPLVIVLALVVGIMSAVLLERQAAQSLTVARQIGAARGRHVERGIREVISQWSDTLAGQPIQKLVDADGHAMDIETPGGELISVYLFDGQGSIVSEPAGLSEEQRTDAEGVYNALASMTSGMVDGGILRPVGPVAVSAMSAPPEVLAAIATYAGSKNGRQFVESILAARQDGEVTDAELETAKNKANVTVQERAVLSRLIVGRPTLYAAVIDVYDATSSVPIARYGARMELGGARSNGGLQQSLDSFLSWEELPLELGSGGVN